MQIHNWKIVPLSQGQLKDVRPEDILENGLYRLCHTYRGGGGYDQFPHIAKHRGLVSTPEAANKQFIAQIFGCNLDCPYCYVTREGIWGKQVKVPTYELVHAFGRSGAKVFHLMGGAPALQLKYWPELIWALLVAYPDALFHSDLMLSESRYSQETLQLIADISTNHALFAINIKGLTPEDWYKNTRKQLDEDLLWANWAKIDRTTLNAYVTFTGCEAEAIAAFWDRAKERGIDVERWELDAYNIDLINYDAIPYVDTIPWGGLKT